MIRGIPITLLGLLLLVQPGRADDRPPRYDMHSHCSRIANSNEGFSAEAEQKCLMLQGDAQAGVRRLWPDASDAIQGDCDRRARADHDEDYLLLLTCVRDQIQRAVPPLTKRTKKTAPP